MVTTNINPVSVVGSLFKIDVTVTEKVDSFHVNATAACVGDED